VFGVKDGIGVYIYIYTRHHYPCNVRATPQWWRECSLEHSRNLWGCGSRTNVAGDSWHSSKIIHPRYCGWSGSNKKSHPMGLRADSFECDVTRLIRGLWLYFRNQIAQNSHLDDSCVFFICTDDFTWVLRIPGRQMCEPTVLGRLRPWFLYDHGTPLFRWDHKEFYVL
jgi:hypothetical protein